MLPLNVHQQADRQRRVFAREEPNGLRNGVLREMEALFLEPKDVAIGRVGDGNRNQDQRGVGAKRGGGFERAGLGSGGLRAGLRKRGNSARRENG